MPSPFPGMDPYLEHPEIFPDFHDRFVTYLSDAIQRELPEPYYAAIGRRVWIELSERFVGPDVNVLAVADPSRRTRATRGGTVVADRLVAKPLIIHVPHDERKEPLVEIFHGRAGQRRLVTAIELLSPTNKTPGERGRDLYLRKQQEILGGQVHLIEIDLLRGGKHTTAVPADRLEAAAAPFDYHISIRHFDDFEDYFVYLIQLPEALPTIPIPLLPDDPVVPIDLQAVFDRTYDAGPYRREIDYQSTSPEPPLSPAQLQWVLEVIHRG
jgi:hypothetical protein